MQCGRNGAVDMDFDERKLFDGTGEDLDCEFQEK